MKAEVNSKISDIISEVNSIKFEENLSKRDRYRVAIKIAEIRKFYTNEATYQYVINELREMIQSTY